MRNLIIYTLLLTLLFSINSCHLNPDEAIEESFEITLPHWPPEDSFSQNYPKLSRWHIQITDAESQTDFYTTEKSISVSAKKNRPFCITAQPLTLLYNGTECAYFKPAGYLYPFTESPINWEQGYLASIMENIFLQGKEECLPPVDIEYLICTFNWKKAQAKIDEKISTSDAYSYNPWLVSQKQIAEGITSHGFKASYFNIKNCAAVTIPQLKELAGTPDLLLLSSFIPENNFLLQKNQFTVVKNSPIIIGDGNKYGLFITYKSTKNISLEYIYLPIYIEDI